MRYRIPVEHIKYGDIELDAIDQDDARAEFYNMSPTEIVADTVWSLDEELDISHGGIEELGESSLWV